MHYARQFVALDFKRHDERRIEEKLVLWIFAKQGQGELNVDFGGKDPHIVSNSNLKILDTTSTLCTDSIQLPPLSTVPFLFYNISCVAFLSLGAHTTNIP